MTNQHTSPIRTDLSSLGPAIVSRCIAGTSSEDYFNAAITVDSKSITSGVYVRIWEDVDADGDASQRIDLSVDQTKALIAALTDALAATMPTATLSRNGNLPTATYSLFDENGVCLAGLGVKTWATAIDSAHAWCDAMGYRLIG